MRPLFPSIQLKPKLIELQPSNLRVQRSSMLKTSVEQCQMKTGINYDHIAMQMKSEATVENKKLQKNKKLTRVSTIDGRSQKDHSRNKYGSISGTNNSHWNILKSNAMMEATNKNKIQLNSINRTTHIPHFASAKLAKQKITLINVSKLSKFNCKFEKETSTGDDLSHIHNSSFKHDFKWNLNITQEEFDHKKKKFDTQQIDLKGEEVVEQIQKSKISQYSRQFESTYRAKEEDQEEEGSLYQSIYQ